MSLTLRIDNYDRLQDGGPIEVTVDRRGLSAGRAIGMDWVLPDPERQISKHHFDVAFRDGAYWLSDLSTNGVFVNGQRYRLDGPHRLAQGDRLQVGPYLISVIVGVGAGLGAGMPAGYGGGYDASGAMPYAPAAPPAADFGDDPWAVDLPPVPPIDPLPRAARPAQPDFTSDFISTPVAAPPAAFTPPPPVAFPGAAAGLRTGGFGALDGGQALGTGLDAPPVPGAGFPAPTGPGLDAAPLGGVASGPPVAGPPLAAPPLAVPPSPAPSMAGLSVAPRPFPAPADGGLAHVPMPMPSAPQRPAPAAPVSPAAAPPMPQPAPISPPRAMAGAPQTAQAFVTAFCEGAGLDPTRYAGVDPVILARELGQTMRTAVAQVMALLQDRASAKKFTRAGERTMLGAMENNPLKFLPDTEQALEALFLAPRDGFQAGSKAMDQALGDVRLHQMALLAAVQPALIKLLADFEPEEIQTASGSGLLSGGGKRKAWDIYVERWDAKVARHENGMLDAFLAHFAEAYAAAVANRKN